jgi:hypothetical protein
MWRLIWGEAANLRFCPEFLAFIYYHLVTSQVELLCGFDWLGLVYTHQLDLHTQHIHPFIHP